MRLYICWNTAPVPRPPHGHPCRRAYLALREAGHDPEVIKVRGLGIGPRFIHQMTDGRREVERLTGQRAVPVLVTDDGEAINESERIVEWAKANQAASEPRAR